MRRVLPWLIVVACLVGMAVVLVLNRRMRADFSEQQSESQQAVQRADARVRDLEARLERQNVALVAALKAGAEARRASRAASAVAATPVAARISRDDMRKDPAYAAAWRHQQLRVIQRNYGEAIAALRLPPDTETKLRSLMVEQNEAKADAAEAARANGLGPKDLNTAEQAATRQVTAQIKGLIGDQGYTQLQQGSQLAIAKNAMNQSLGLDLEAAGASLSPQQQVAVAKVYSKAQRSPGMTADVDTATGLSGRNLALYNGVADLLNQRQLSAVKESLVDEQMETQFAQQQRARQAAAAASGTGGTE